METIRATSCRHETRYRPMNRLFRTLKPVMEDDGLKRTVSHLDRKVAIFDELRDALRIALPEGKNGLNDDGGDTDIGTIEPRVKKFRSKLIADNSNIDCKKMIEQIDTYWDKLFADSIPIHTEQGVVMVQPQRTNNILERFFRDFKR